MESASRQPVETAFDKDKNAAINEGTPVSTANTLGQGNQAPHPISGTADATTGNAPAADAPGYLQQAREALVSLAGTAQNAMGIDTPASTLHSIADNTKVDASMPTSEAKGATSGERVGGVGSLPGNASEEGVARLPAERTSVPSRELEGAYPGEKSGGVGALPGGPNETGVALLPDERSSNVEGSAIKSHIAGSTNTSNLGSSATHEHTSAPSRELQGTHSTEKTGGVGSLLRGEHSSANKSNTGTSATKPDIGSAAHAAAHPKSENPDKGDLKTAAAHPIETAKQRRGSASSSSSSDEEGATGTDKASRKVSLKDKLAGGMKVATGKIKKDQDMVAEGQAMRGH